MDPIAEIRQLYFNATRATIERDIRRAIDLLKSMGTEDERDRAAVYMSGLAEMRKEWNNTGGRNRAATPAESTRRRRR